MIATDWIALGGVVASVLIAQRVQITGLMKSQHEDMKARHDSLEEKTDEHAVLIHGIDNRLTSVETVCRIRHRDPIVGGV